MDHAHSNAATHHASARGRWMALVAALLGWMFDGFEIGMFPLVGRPALGELLAGRALLQETDGLPVTRPGVPPPKFIPPTSALSNVIDTTKNSYGVDLNKEINTWRETFGIK